MMMKTNKRNTGRSFARIALGATAVLALAGRAHAVACAANTFYDGSSTDCTACPTGTTAAAVPVVGTQTWCEGIAANYYGTAGNVASADATPTACPFAGTSAGSLTTTTISACTPPDCATTTIGSNAVAVSNTCQCAANFYGSPVDTNGNTVLAVTGGCTACPTGFSSLQASAARESCYLDIPVATYTTVFTDPDHATTGILGSAVTALSDIFIVGTSNVVTGGTALTTLRVNACPEGTSSDETFAAVLNPAITLANTFCGVIKSGYYGTSGAGGTGSWSTHATGATSCISTYSNAANVAAAFASTNPTTATAASAKNVCATAPGYIITTVIGTGADTVVVIAQVGANKYAAGGSILATTAAVETGTACPTNSASAAGSNEIADCKCNGGYSAGSTTCLVCTANTYKAAGDAVGTPTNCVGCATGYSSVAGSSTCTQIESSVSSGASSASVLAAISAMAAAQLVL